MVGRKVRKDIFQRGLWHDLFTGNLILDHITLFLTSTFFSTTL
jgi:hypothetical protein